MADLIDNWRDELLMNMQNDAKWKDWATQFNAAQSDKERFAAVYNLPFIDKVIRIDYLLAEKSASKSKELRDKGNVEYVKKNYENAFELYTQSIQNAPLTGDVLALGHANRSAVLIDTKKYHLCLNDIDLAIAHNYPAKLMHKLLERQGRCKYEIGLVEDAAKCFQEAIEKLSESTLDTEKQKGRQVKLEELLALCKEKPDKTVKHEPGYEYMEPIPEIDGEKSDKFPCTSDAVSLKTSKSKGRYVFATRDIDVGEVMAVEKPYSSVVNEKYHITHCHHCCKRAELPIPCLSCSEVVYCSAACQEDSWNDYHSVECSILLPVKLLNSDLAHLALRMVIKAKCDYIKKFEETYENAKPTKFGSLGFNEKGVFDSKDYWAIYNLVNHSDERTFSDLFRRTLTAIYVLKCLKKTNFFSKIDDSTKDIHLEVGGHILRHLQMLPCNAHEVTELFINPSKMVNSKCLGIGSAIYATLSLFNHSCDPNVVRYSYGDVCVVRAIHRISKGSEIVDSYSILYPVDSKDRRSTELSRQYYFECSCEACVCDWPLYENIPNHTPQFICEKCGALIGEYEEDEAYVCKKCDTRQGMIDRVRELMKTEPQFDTVFNDVISGAFSDEIFTFLLNHLSLLERWLCRPWQDINRCQEALKQCYSYKANHFTSRKLSKS